MTNRLVVQTTALRQAGLRGISPYLTAGDGGLDCTLAILHALDEAKVNCVELGIPFSDPIADGPALQAASERALSEGASLHATLEMLQEFRHQGGQLPIAIMSYANPLVRNGLEQTAEQIAAAGGDALIVPDIPLEEGTFLESACVNSGLCPIFFAAPTSSSERISEAGSRSKGFMYVVGRTGVTGSGTSFDEETQDFLSKARSLSSTPIAVGFGINNAATVRAATEHADLAIVGTAFVNHLHNVGGDKNQRAQAAKEFVGELQQGLN